MKELAELIINDQYYEVIDIINILNDIFDSANIDLNELDFSNIDLNNTIDTYEILIFEYFNYLEYNNLIEIDTSNLEIGYFSGINYIGDSLDEIEEIKKYNEQYDLKINI